MLKRRLERTWSHAAHSGQPPATVYFNTIETDQQVRAVAELSRKSVQRSGNSSCCQLLAHLGQF